MKTENELGNLKKEKYKEKNQSPLQMRVGMDQSIMQLNRYITKHIFSMKKNVEIFCVPLFQWFFCIIR